MAKSVSKITKQLVLLEAGFKCANPRCRHIITLEVHHIVWVKDGGGNEPDNLLALCPNCHSLHTAGHIPQSAIRAWKSLLVSLNNPNRLSADLLLLLYDEQKRVESKPKTEEQPPPFRFTGDGLGILSSPLVSGLVEIYSRYSGASYFGGGMPSFEVRVTDAGKRLVEAWLKGNPDEITKALSAVYPEANNDR